MSPNLIERLTQEVFSPDADEKAIKSKEHILSIYWSARKASFKAKYKKERAQSVKDEFDKVNRAIVKVVTDGEIEDRWDVWKKTRELELQKCGTEKSSSRVKRSRYGMLSLHRTDVLMIREVLGMRAALVLGEANISTIYDKCNGPGHVILCFLEHLDTCKDGHGNTGVDANTHSESTIDPCEDADFEIQRPIANSMQCPDTIEISTPGLQSPIHFVPEHSKKRTLDEASSGPAKRPCGGSDPLADGTFQSENWHPPTGHGGDQPITLSRNPKLREVICVQRRNLCSAIEYLNKTKHASYKNDAWHIFPILEAESIKGTPPELDLPADVVISQVAVHLPILDPLSGPTSVPDAMFEFFYFRSERMTINATER